MSRAWCCDRHNIMSTSSEHNSTAHTSNSTAVAYTPNVMHTLRTLQQVHQAHAGRYALETLLLSLAITPTRQLRSRKHHSSEAANPSWTYSNKTKQIVKLTHYSRFSRCRSAGTDDVGAVAARPEGVVCVCVICWRCLLRSHHSSRKSNRYK